MTESRCGFPFVGFLLQALSIAVKVVAVLLTIQNRLACFILAFHSVPRTILDMLVGHSQPSLHKACCLCEAAFPRRKILSSLLHSFAVRLCFILFISLFQFPPFSLLIRSFLLLFTSPLLVFFFSHYNTRNLTFVRFAHIFIVAFLCHSPSLLPPLVCAM